MDESYFLMPVLYPFNCDYEPIVDLDIFFSIPSSSNIEKWRESKIRDIA